MASTRRERPLLAGHADNAVTVGLVPRDLLDGDQAAGLAVVNFGHLRHAAVAAAVGDQIVGEHDGEGFVADHGLGAQDGVAKAEGHGLAQSDAGDSGRKNFPHLLELFQLVPGLQLALQLRCVVVMIFDRALGAAGDEDQLGDAGGDGLLGSVLDQRLVDDRQHLLGGDLGRRQETRAQPRHGKNRLADAAHPLGLSQGE